VTSVALKNRKVSRFDFPPSLARPALIIVIYYAIRAAQIKTYTHKVTAEYEEMSTKIQSDKHSLPLLRRNLNHIRYDTIRYDTRCYFNVHSKADISQLNLPHGTDN